MNTGAKFLFIEDEKSNLSFILNGLTAAIPRQDNEQLPDKNCFSEFNKNNYIKKIACFAESLQDALEKIDDVCVGKTRYECIFLDRNLSSFSDSKTGEIKYNGGSYIPTSNESKIYDGDNLYVRLICAGIPAESIFIMTANDPQKEQMALPYFIDKNKVQVISRTRDTGTADEDVFEDDTENENSESKFVSVLRNCINTKVRFRYSEIFDSPRFQEIFSDNAISSWDEKFIEILARVLYGRVDDQLSDIGITLRNMTEYICDWLGREKFSANNSDNYDVRYTLNSCESKYNFNYINFSKTLQELLYEHVKIIRQSPQEAENAVNTCIYMAAANFFLQDKSAIPKFILSYIDNIYTVTSEFSAHGRRNHTYNDVSREGWTALVYEMVQVLQWCVKTEKESLPLPQELKNNKKVVDFHLPKCLVTIGLDSYPQDMKGMWVSIKGGLRKDCDRWSGFHYGEVIDVQ